MIQTAFVENHSKKVRLYGVCGRDTKIATVVSSLAFTYFEGVCVGETRRRYRFLWQPLKFEFFKFLWFSIKRSFYSGFP